MSRLDLMVDVDVKGDDRLRNLGSGLANIATIAAGAVAGVAAVGAFTSNFASDLNESLNKVNVVFGEQAEAVKAWSETAAAAMGLSQQTALEAAGTFGNLLTALDVQPRAAADMSRSLVELASDLASFNNMEVTDVLDRLRSGMLGEQEAVERLGIVLSEARLKQLAFDMGLTDSLTGVLAPAIRSQAAYAAILEDTTTAQGDFARTSGGMANQQRTLAATFSDTMADLGQAFLPLIESLLPQVTAGLQGFGAWVTENMPTIQAVLQNLLGGVGTGFNLLGSAISFIVTDVLPVVQAAITFFTANILPGLTAAFQAVVTWITANMPTISSVFGQVFGAIANVIGAVWPIIEAIATVLFPIVSTAASVLLSALDITFKAIGGVFEVIGNVASTIFKTIVSVWDGLGEAFENVWKGVNEAVKGGINFFIGLINGLIDMINGIQIHIPRIGIPDGPGIGPFDWNGLNLGKIPMLAEGGMISSPTLAMLGESGPEVVIPLDQLQMGTEVNLIVQGDLQADERTLPGQMLRALYVAGLGT